MEIWQVCRGLSHLQLYITSSNVGTSWTRSPFFLIRIRHTSIAIMAKGKASQNKYSVILPTYNERQNLPVLVQMLYDVFTREYVPRP